MDTKKFFDMQKEIQAERSKRSLRSPYFITGALFLILILAIGLLKLGPLESSLTSIQDLTTNGRYISSLAANTTRLSFAVVSLQSAVATIWFMIYITGMLVGIIFVLLVFLALNKKAERPENFKELVSQRLREKGYTEKDIRDYLKQRYEIVQWQRI